MKDEKFTFKALWLDQSPKAKFIKMAAMLPLILIVVLLYWLSPGYRESLGTLGISILGIASLILLWELIKVYREWKKG